MDKAKIKNYPPIVIREKNDGVEYFRATFKEFPKMIGGIGNTVEKAIQEAYEMLETEIGFLEEMGGNVPEPFVSDLADAPSGRVTLRMGVALHEKLIEAAEKDGVSINSEITTALAYWLGERSGKKSSANNASAYITAYRPTESAPQRTDMASGSLMPSPAKA